MKVYVLGASHTGKTPLARRVAAALDVPCIAASAWVRAKFPALPDGAADAERAAQVADMTAWAIRELRADPDRSAAVLRATAPGRCVIEGIRNPYDFVTTFDPRCDLAVLLAHTGSALVPTAFEGGLDVIRGYLAWAEAAGLLAAGRVLDHRYARFGEVGRDEPDTLEHAIVAVIAATTAHAAEQADPPQRVHAAIPPLPVLIRAEYLYGMDPARAGELVHGRAFSVSSYLGSAPTLNVILGDGAVFSYLPPWALVVEPPRVAGLQPAAPPLPIDARDLVYHDCKSTLISVHDFPALHGRALAYFKRVDRWVDAEYRFTIDWYAGNEMLHALVLATGQLALLPSHKVKFGDHPPGFAPYKKLRREWSVESLGGSDQSGQSGQSGQSAPGQSGPGQSGPGQSGPGQSGPGQSG